MSHVDEGTLHAYLDGQLPSSERAALEAHLAQCANCSATLVEARALLARANSMLGTARPVERPMPPLEQLRRMPRRAPWHVRTSLAWAASVVLALAIGYSVRPRAPEPAPIVVARAPAQRERQPQQLKPTRRPPVHARDAARAPQPSDEIGQVAEKARADTPAVTSGMSDAIAMQPQAQMRNSAPAPAARALGSSASGMSQWQLISRSTAASLLGEKPVGLPGLATRRIRRSPGADATVVVEQALDSSTVIEIFQRPVTDSYTRLEQDRSAPGDRLARFVGRLRVEIAGPLSPDSLNRLLDQVQPLR
ncbi:MAG: anti-sigma factor [Gemmatimonadales bacterium]